MSDVKPLIVTHVTVERFKESGKFYDSVNWTTSINVSDIPAIKAEYVALLGKEPDMNYTLEVEQDDQSKSSHELQPWNKYLVIVK